MMVLSLSTSKPRIVGAGDSVPESPRREKAGEMGQPTPNSPSLPARRSPVRRSSFRRSGEPGTCTTHVYRRHSGAAVE